MTTLADVPTKDLSFPEEHMDAIIAAFSESWREKYMKGQKEHGGRLWRKQCLPFLVEEVLDFVSYVAVLAPQLKRVEELLEHARNEVVVGDQASASIDAALNLLRYGNEEGVPEEEN